MSPPDPRQSVTLKSLGNLKGGSGFPDHEQGQKGHAIPFFKVKALDRSPFLLSTEHADDTITIETARRLGATVFPSGSIVFAKVGAALLLARFRVLAQPSCIDNNMMALRLRPDAMLPRFAWYAIGVLDFSYIVNPGAVPSVNAGKVGAQMIPCPSAESQKKITDFLDIETKQSDVLAGKYQTLIDLTEEKRLALVTRVVTQGVDAAIPMQRSAYPNIGATPQHWEIGPVKRFFNVLDGRRIPISSEERSTKPGPYPYYGASGIIDHVEGYIFDEDLVLVSEDGANLLARSTPISFLATGKYWVNNHAHILRPKNYDSLAFWTERLEVENITPYVTGSAQPKLTIEALKNMIISAPTSMEERSEIARQIEQVTEAANLLKTAARTAISLIAERRKAIVAAAVTGLINVDTYDREHGPAEVAV